MPDSRSARAVVTRFCGSSSEATAASQSCSRRLTVFSGIGCVFLIVDVRAIRLEPGGVSIAQLALVERPALVICVSGEAGRPGAATVDEASVPNIRIAIIWISAATRYFSFRRGSSLAMHLAREHLRESSLFWVDVVS